MGGELGILSSGTSKIKEYLPFIRAEEIDLIKYEIAGMNVSVACDATPFNNTVRFGCCLVWRAARDYVAVFPRGAWFSFLAQSKCS